MRWLGFVVFCLACREAPSREQTIDGVRFVEKFEHGADDDSPLVVGLHGLGGSPERFARQLANLPFTAEVVLAQGFMPTDGGWSWFDWPPSTSDDALAAIVAAADAKLWPAIEALAHGRRVIVTGFSQGAVLAYALAVRHPDVVRYALPIAGRLPAKLWPKDAHVAPIYAMHGAEDTRIEIEYARKAIAAVRAAGGTAELREWPGVGHDITPAMHADLVARLAHIIAP